MQITELVAAEARRHTQWQVFEPYSTQDVVRLDRAERARAGRRAARRARWLGLARSLVAVLRPAPASARGPVLRGSLASADEGC